jgi:hypothetical protein
VTFPARRWAQLVHALDTSDDQVRLMTMQQYEKLQWHVGECWHVSVTTSFPCVDSRQFYYHTTQGIRPTKTGIALRLNEWVQMKEIITEVHRIGWPMDLGEDSEQVRSASIQCIKRSINIACTSHICGNKPWTIITLPEYCSSIIARVLIMLITK